MFLLFNLILAFSPQIEKDTIKTISKDPWLSQDKFHHFAHSAAISSSLYLITNRFGSFNKENSAYISFSITSLIGGTKELIDKSSKKGNASVKDFVYDIAGVVIGIVLISLGSS